MLDAGPSSSIGDDLDRLEDILPSEPVDLSDWLEPPTLQSRVPSLKVEDLLVDTGPIAAYERLRISFLQQDAHRVDENHETGDKEYIYTNQRPFKVVLQAQGANGGPLPIDNLHLTVRLMLESGSDVEAESKQHGAHGPLLIGDTRVAVGSDGLATFELTLGRTALSSFCSGQRFCLLFRADLPADLLDEPRLAHLSVLSVPFKSLTKLHRASAAQRASALRQQQQRYSETGLTFAEGNPFGKSASLDEGSDGLQRVGSGHLPLTIGTAVPALPEMYQMLLESRATTAQVCAQAHRVEGDHARAWEPVSTNSGGRYKSSTTGQAGCIPTPSPSQRYSLGRLSLRRCHHTQPALPRLSATLSRLRCGASKVRRRLRRLLLARRRCASS